VAGDPADCPWTLEKAMQTYWRVRTWTFSASGTIEEEEGGNFPFSTTITDITSRDVETAFPQTLEEGLVCGNLFEGIISNAYCRIEFYQAETSGDLYNSGLVGEVVDDSNSLEFVFAANISSAFNISILSTNIPITIDYVEEGGTVISGSATLTPTLWWSYGGKYDPATGDPL
jgi:hypothetical protein